MLNRWPVLLLTLGLLASGTLSLAADDKKDAKVKEELKKLQGNWKAVSMQMGTDKAPEQVLAQAAFEIKDNKMIEKGHKSSTEIAIDPTSDPKMIDMTGEVSVSQRNRKTGKQEVTKRKETTKGVYTLEDDKLTICLNTDPKGDRPSAIQGGKGLVLAVFKRQKP